jgi:hypothetical protein
LGRGGLGKVIYQLAFADWKLTHKKTIDWMTKKCVGHTIVFAVKTRNGAMKARLEDMSYYELILSNVEWTPKCDLRSVLTKGKRLEAVLDGFAWQEVVENVMYPTELINYDQPIYRLDGS